MNHDSAEFVIARKDLPPAFVKTGWALLLIGIVLAGISYITDVDRALQNTLIGFAFLVSVSVGAVFYIALEFIAGAVWSTPFRRVTEFLAASLPVALLLAVPLLLNMHRLYEWTDPEAVAKSHLVSGKTSYLNMQFFVLRYVFMAAVWFLFYLVFRKHSLAQDLNKDQRHTTTAIKFAGAFIPLFAITIAFFGIDWLMTLSAEWFSTIFPVYFFASVAVCALSFITVITVYLAERGHFLREVREDHYYSFGALLFALLSFWAYIAFSQFMLIWYANLPDENFWFIARWQNGWEYVSSALGLFYFWVPYFMLVSRPSKMNRGNLKRTSVLLIAANLLNLYWLVMPTFHAAPVFSYHEIAFPALTIGLLIVIFSMQAKKYNMVPIGDPKLQQGIDFYL